MKVTFLRPSMIAGRAGDAMEPRVFAILAGLTPPDVERVLYDEQVEPLPLDEPTDLVAITVDTFTARRAYQLAGEYHRRGVPVVMGGHHPTLAPDEALCFASAVVLGDAEGVWPHVIQDAREGRLQRRYENRSPTLAGSPVDRSGVDAKPYRPISLVEFGRGCPHACDFCSVHNFYGGTIRHRPVDEVAAEIASLHGRHLFFTDDNLFADARAALDLLPALKAARRRWSCQTSIEVATHAETLRQMAESGCTVVTVGFESLVPENLGQMHKSWNAQHGRFADLVSRFHDHGIMVYGAFVFGYDHDTIDVFAKTVEFAVASKLFLANFNPLTPTPGTSLYTRLAQDNRLIRPRWWLHPEYRYGDALFLPKRMTAEQLAEGCYWAKTEFNRLGSILKRSLDRRANAGSLAHLGLYLAGNLVSHREIRRKQGQNLGSVEPLVPVFGTLPT